jgi:hypothetical protein
MAFIDSIWAAPLQKPASVIDDVRENEQQQYYAGGNAV